MARNANGEGSIYKRIRNGRPVGYVGALSYIAEDGTRKRQRVYGITRAETREKLNAVRERVSSGVPARDSSTAVGAWLRHWRETTLAVSDRKPSTKELYANLARRHLESEPFGNIRLDRLKPADVEALILVLRAKTKVRQGETVRALADSTIRQIYTVLRLGLDGAIRDGMIARNPAAAVKRPGVQRTEVVFLDMAEVAAILKHAESSRYHRALVLIATTGLRRGEALALRWDKIDLNAGQLRVDWTIGRVDGELLITVPKTVSSRRAVPLAPAVVDLLRKQWAAQAAERLRAGNQWTDSGLVFTTELGKPVDPRNVLRLVEVAAAAAKIEANVGAHTLRHSAAVAWLEGGVHIKAAADLLGHSSIAITGDIYGHTSDGAARAAVEGLAGALGL